MEELKSDIKLAFKDSIQYLPGRDYVFEELEDDILMLVYRDVREFDSLSSNPDMLDFVYKSLLKSLPKFDSLEEAMAYRQGIFDKIPWREDRNFHWLSKFTYDQTSGEVVFIAKVLSSPKTQHKFGVRGGSQVGNKVVVSLTHWSSAQESDQNNLEWIEQEFRVSVLLDGSPLSRVDQLVVDQQNVALD